MQTIFTRDRKLPRSLRLLVALFNVSDKEIQNRRAMLLNGVKALNCMERMVGWPLTKHYDVEVFGKEPIIIDVKSSEGILKKEIKYHCPPSYNRDSVSCIKGSMRWIKSPYMFSLCLLVLKMGMSELLDGDFTNFDEMVSVARKNLKTKTPVLHTTYFAHNSILYWKAILKNYRSLFQGRPADYLWHDTYSYGYGLHVLLQGATSSADLNREIVEIKKKVHNDAKKV
jgi:hypothetical protein